MMDFTLFSDGRSIPYASFLNSTSFPDVLVNLSDTQLPCLNITPIDSQKKIKQITNEKSAEKLIELEKEVMRDFSNRQLSPEKIPLDMNNFNSSIDSLTDRVQSLLGRTGDGTNNNDKVPYMLTPIIETSKENEVSTMSKNYKKVNIAMGDNKSYEKFTLTTPSTSAISFTEFETPQREICLSNSDDSSDNTSAPISLSTEPPETVNNKPQSPKLNQPKKSQRRVNFFSDTKLIDISNNNHVNNKEQDLVLTNDPSSILNEVNKVLEKIRLIKEKSKSSLPASPSTIVVDSSNDKHSDASSSIESVKSISNHSSTNNSLNLIQFNQMPLNSNLDLILTDQSEPTEYYQPPDHLDKLSFMNETFQSHIYSPLTTNVSEGVPNPIKRSSTFVKERINNNANNNNKSIESMPPPSLPPAQPLSESRPQSACSSVMSSDSRLSSSEERIMLQQQEAKFLQIVDRERSHLRSIQKELVRLEKAYLKQQPPPNHHSSRPRQTKPKRQSAIGQSTGETISSSSEIIAVTTATTKSTNSGDCHTKLPNHLLLTKQGDIGVDSNNRYRKRSSSTSQSEIDTFPHGNNGAGGTAGLHGSTNVLHQKHCKLAQQVNKQMKSDCNLYKRRELEQRKQTTAEHSCQCCCSRRYSKKMNHLELNDDYIYQFECLKLNQPPYFGQRRNQKILHKDEDPCCNNINNNDHYDDFRNFVQARPNSNVDQSVQTSLIIDTSRSTTTTTTNAKQTTRDNNIADSLANNNRFHEPVPKDNTKKKKPVAWVLTFDDLNRIDANNQANVRKIPKRSSPNLQEAFTRNCNQFKLRSARRVRLIKDNADLRVQTADQRRNEIAQTYFMKKQIENEQRQASAASSRTSGTVAKPNTTTTANKVVGGNAKQTNNRYPRPLPMITRRVFTHREMRAQTEKVYSKLPEVKAQKVTVKREDEARRRRVMADIFKQRLKESVIRGKLNWPITTQAIST